MLVHKKNDIVMISYLISIGQVKSMSKSRRRSSCKHAAIAKHSSTLEGI